MKKIAGFLLCLMIVIDGMSQMQDIKIAAQLDSNRIIIGDHLQMHIVVSASADQGITFQSHEQWQLINCEVVEVSTMQVAVKGEVATYTQDATLISFDTGVAKVAPIVISIGDTMVIGATNPLQFYVDSLPVFVDTTQDFKDIKMPLEGSDIELLPKENQGHNWKHILVILLVLAIVGALLYVGWKYGRKYLQERKVAATKLKLKENAGVLALSMLKSLKSKKLWQKGQVKDYYSELSMILREYIDNQWDVNAKEMVTPDIMEAIDNLDIDDEQIRTLSDLLRSADLVKFAKEQPLIEENEASYKRACDFVRVTDHHEREKMVEENQKNRKK